jgi:type IV secretion system protein VirB10
VEQEPAPRTPPPELPKKPINTVKWGLYGFIGLMLLAVLLQIKGGLASQPRSEKDTYTPLATAPSQIKHFGDAEQQEEHKALQDQQGAIDEALRKMQLAGKGEVQIPPPTAAQEQVIRRSHGGSVARAEKHQEKASSMVAFDFTREEAKQDVGPVVAGKPTEPVKPSKTAYDFDKPVGPMYRMFEGTVIESVLTNRLDGSFTGPVNVMVSSDYYSKDQTLLVKRGTRILGEAKRVNAMGQQRLVVTFHRMIYPNGYSVSLDKDPGLDQIGATGIGGKVNNHWLKVFGTSIALGAIGGLAQIGNGGYVNDGSAAIRNGISTRFGQEADVVLERYMNILPTITVYEGTRVRVWLSADLLVPAYENAIVEEPQHAANQS